MLLLRFDVHIGNKTLNKNDAAMAVSFEHFIDNWMQKGSVGMKNKRLRNTYLYIFMFGKQPTIKACISVKQQKITENNSRTS